MPQPPITRKPIPKSVEAWRREVAGIRRLLDTIPAHYRDNGAKWVRAMRDYHRRRLDDLLDNGPKSLVKTGEARQARVE